MDICLYLSLKEIEQRVNQSFGDILFQGKNPDGGGSIAQVTVRKLTPILIEAVDQSLYSTTSVHVDLNIKMQEAGFIDLLQDISGFQRLSFELRVSIQTQLHVSPEGHLIPESEARFKWERKPRLGISILKVSVSGMIQPMLERQLADVAREVDQYIVQEIQMEKQIQQAWEVSQVRVCIDSQFPLWFRLKAHEGVITIKDWLYEKDRLGVVFEVPLQPEAWVGEIPEADSNIMLPAIASNLNLPADPAILLPSHISYTALSRHIGEKTYRSPDGLNWLYIEGLKFSGKGNQIHCQLNFKGKFSWKKLRKKAQGGCYLQAQLTVDSAKHLVRVQKLSYKLRKSSLLNRLLNRLLHKKICIYIEKAINQTLQNEWKHIQTQVADGVKDYPLHPNVQLRGKLASFIPLQIKAQENGISLDIRIKWKANIWLKDLDQV